MSFLEILCLVVSGIVCLYFYLIRNHGYWVKRGIPGPKATFVVGNLPGAMTQKRNSVYDMEEIYYKWKKEANFVGFFNMMKPQILILKPELIKMITVKNFQNFHDNDFSDMADSFSDPVFTKTIFMLRGLEWKERRAELAPVFTDNKMKSMFVLIEDISRKLLHHLNESMNSSGSPLVLEARTLCTKFSIDVIGNCIFRLDGRALTEEYSEMLKMGEELMNPSPSFLISFLLLQFFPFLKGIVRARLVKKTVADYLEKHIQDVIQKRKNNPTAGLDFMSFMEHLRTTKGTPPEQILGHVFTFFINGYEMSSNVMSHTLYQLAKNPEVQERLRDEVLALESLECTVYPNNEQCDYLNRVVLESLRINAPLPYLTKRCTKGCSLPLTEDQEIFIDTNTPLVIPVYCIQRDPEYYPHPDTFDPDRFLDGNAKKLQNDGVFLPFGDGPRICMGMKFAMMQIKIGIATIVKKYRLTLDPKTVEPFILNPKRFTTVPEGGYWIQLVPIDKK
ncbi:hypothetical protein DMENIID0001_114300 [Sergentomyia squamirostris]